MKFEKVEKTDEEWKKILTPEQYDILRKKGTERPGSCALLNVKDKGVYSCVACGNKIFESKMKFESGTGWPSFFEPYNENSIEYKEDNSLLGKRTEVICKKCGGHLGHVFNDGPNGKKRYCINGIVLKFKKSN